MSGDGANGKSSNGTSGGARARLCFRALSLCLAALVLVLVAMNLHELFKAATDTLETMLKGLSKR